jgi:lysophospholipase L1-like esterase
MYGARHVLTEAIPQIEIEADIGRQAPETIRLLRQQREQGELGTIVIVHLGSNGIFREAQFNEIMETLADAPKVIFVSVRVPRRWQDPINSMLAKKTMQHANAMVADWYGASADHPEYLRPDGVHLDTEGAAAYAELLQRAIRDPLPPSALDRLPE